MLKIYADNNFKFFRLQGKIQKANFLITKAIRFKYVVNHMLVKIYNIISYAPHETVGLIN